MKKFLVIGALFSLSFCQSVEQQQKEKFYYTDQKTEEEIWNEISINIQKKDFSKIQSQISKLSHKNNPKYLQILGDYFFEQKDYEKSLEFYSSSYKLQKEVSLGLRISENLIILAQLEEALSFLEKMKEDFGEQTQIILQLGVLYKQNEPHKAEKIFENLLTRKIEEEKIHLHYLDSLLLQGKYEKVENYLQNIKQKSFARNFLYIWEVHFYIEQARHFLEKNQISSAIQSLAIAHGIASENEELTFELVNLLCKVGEFTKAEKLISEMKDLEWKFLALGVYFFYKKDFEQSLEYLEEGNLNYPNNSEYKKQLGNLFFYLGDIAKAKIYFYEGKKLNPKDSFFPLMLGKIALEENLLEVASLEFQIARNLGSDNAKLLYKFSYCLLKETKKELEMCEKELIEISHFEEKIVFLNLFGNFYFKKQNFTKAKTFFQLSLKEKTQFFVLLKLYEISNLEGNLKEQNEYEKKILSIIKENPEKKEIFVKFKNKFFITKKTENLSRSNLKNFSSLEIIQTYLKPLDFSKLQEIITFLEEIDQKQKALEILRLLIQENSNLEEFYGVYLAKLGETWKAFEIFKNLQSKENNYFIEYNLGYILLKTNPSHALEHFFESLKLNSNYLFTYLGIAKAYYSLYDYEKAKYYLALAKEKFGEKEVILWNLGFLELSQGDLKQAKSIFLEMKRKYSSSDAFYGLALVAEKQENYNLVKKYLFQAIKKEEKKEYLEKLLKILEQENSPEFTKYQDLLLKKFPKSSVFKELKLSDKDIVIYEAKFPFSTKEIKSLNVTNDSLYVVIKNKLYCLEKKSFAPKWSQVLAEEVWASYFFELGILIQTSKNQFFFFDKLTGELLWERKFIVSKIEKIEGHFTLFMIVVLENKIRKLYQLDYRGNIINDLVLDFNEEFYLDLEEKPYILSRTNDNTIFYELSPNWKKQKIKKWKGLEIQFLAKGKNGIYFQTPKGIELVSSKIQKNFPYPICADWKIVEFEEEIYSICLEKVFKFENDWKQLNKKALLSKLKFLECSEINCLLSLLKEKNHQILQKEKLYFLEMLLNSSKN